MPTNPGLPDRLVMLVPHLDPKEGAQAALYATKLAQRWCPRLSGLTARVLSPYVGHDEFGISWPAEVNYIWFQESGTSPFTMRSLAGKTIPMWIDDPTGAERRKNPKARTRRTANGRTQVLIFRRAARIGATKMVGGRRVPQSYPGAPGRIVTREVAEPYPPGRHTGRISSPSARPHVGVRWRHPGLHPRSFLRQAILSAGLQFNVQGRIEPGYGAH